MRSFLIQAFLSVLIMVTTCQGNCEEFPEQQASGTDQSKWNSDLQKLPSFLMKRLYNGLPYDGFVGLMGKRSADTKETVSSEKRDMHDFFVGLMGKRNVDAANKLTAISKETPTGFRGPTLSKCRMRFRRSTQRD
ncbi:tachykinin-3a isoform X2 [Latimeria chalumnae]|uniref:tachykinin-3a isoform X2 n=1 Tax=Latimeria chalumnae TaxID=7897 RepID=UPI00313BEF86